jgi:hypothetical protein
MWQAAAWGALTALGGSADRKVGPAGLPGLARDAYEAPKFGRQCDLAPPGVKPWELAGFRVPGPSDTVARP